MGAGEGSCHLLICFKGAYQSSDLYVDISRKAESSESWSRSRNRAREAGCFSCYLSELYLIIATWPTHCLVTQSTVTSVSQCCWLILITVMSPFIFKPKPPAIGKHQVGTQQSQASRACGRCEDRPHQRRGLKVWQLFRARRALEVGGGWAEALP